MRTEGNGGTRPATEIQAEIDRTRHEMDGTLSAIEQRLSPGQIIDQGMSYLRRNGGTEFVANLGEQAKQNPMPVALVGLGIAWLMAGGKVSAAGESASSKLGEAKDRLADTANATRDGYVRARDGIEAMMREQPLALGALGLALGALAAALAPRTEMEDRIAGKAAGELQKQDPRESAPPRQSGDPLRPYADPAVEVPPPFRGG